MEISFRLSTQDIARAKRELKAYRQGLIDKCRTFVETLAEKGIAVAVNNSGEYGDLITFEKSVDQTKTGATAILLAASGTVTQTWLVPDGTGGLRERSADISPLLLAEYGSGWKSSTATGMPNVDKALELGMTQGSFWEKGTYSPDKPDRNHAFDKPWYWFGTDYEWHSSVGEEATMPMFRAVLAMEMDIIETAMEVFGT